MSKVAIIGGGLGGLAAACVAQARGHQVTLFDKNEWLGGKAAVLHLDALATPGGSNGGSFRFDMGPTILTVPRVLRRIFAEAGREQARDLPLIRLDPQWRCFFDDGTRIDLRENVEAMARDMDEFAPGNGSGYREFQRMSENLHRISEGFFFWKSVEGLTDTVDFRANMRSDTLKDVMALGMGRTVAKVIRGHVPDARLAQMLDHYCQYVGSSPYLAPAVLSSIGDMQASEGIWYPVGGTRAVAEGLAKLAEALGADLRPNTEVTGLDLRDNGTRVAGVIAKGQTIPFDAVISNMDAIRTYKELVGGKTGRKYEKKGFEPACSGVVLYL
ncbi:MAG TPA: FAD-dependent oxidoreductase, partial [Roseomonas sp.]